MSEVDVPVLLSPFSGASRESLYMMRYSETMRLQRQVRLGQVK